VAEKVTDELSPLTGAAVTVTLAGVVTAVPLIVAEML
jgi:hypothetical protein